MRTSDYSEDISKLFAELEYLRSEIDKRAERESVVEMINNIKQMKSQIAQTPSQDMNEF